MLAASNENQHNPFQNDTSLVLEQHPSQVNIYEKVHNIRDYQQKESSDELTSLLPVPHMYQQSTYLPDTTIVSDQNVDIDEKMHVLDDIQEYQQKENSDKMLLSAALQYEQNNFQHDTTLASEQDVYSDEKRHVLDAIQEYEQTDTHHCHQYNASVISDQAVDMSEEIEHNSVLTTLNEYQMTGRLCESMSLLANLHQCQRTGNVGRLEVEKTVVSEKHKNTDLADEKNSVLSTISHCQQMGNTRYESNPVSEKHVYICSEVEKKDVSVDCQHTYHPCDEMNLLATLHQYQQTGHLCDVTLVSTENREFVAHAVVLAAASSVLTQELSECDHGNYKIVMPLNSIETDTFIQLAYTGQMSISKFCDMSKLNYFCDRCDAECHEKKIIKELCEFSERGLFSNVTWFAINSKIQPTNSVLMAFRYNFMSPYIKTGSVVKVKISGVDGNTGNECHTCHKHFDIKYPSSEHDRVDIRDKQFTCDTVDIRDKQFTCDMCKHCLKAKVLVKRLELNPMYDKRFTINSEKRKYEYAQNCTRYTCATCYKSFNTKYALKEHQSIYVSGCHYINVNPFMCQFCNKCFKTKKEFKIHESAHRAVRPYKCAICDKCFRTSQHLKSHGRVHDNDRPYTCDKCKARFKTKMGVRKHQTIHTNVKAYECGKCSKRYKTGEGLKEHQLAHLGERAYACGICDKYFNTKENMKRHRFLHSGVKPYVCTTCNKCFGRRAHLQQHGAVHSTKRPYTCELCNTSFKSQNDFRLHQYIHTGEKLFSCTICKKSFRSRFKLKVHGVVHSDERPYPCEICDKRFKDETQFKVHGRVHSENRAFECDKCNKILKSKAALKCHDIIHTGNTPYKCTTCNQGFTCQSSLNNHESLHVAKPHLCTTCGKYYKTKLELKIHDSAFHSGGRPYICSTCHKGFTTMKILKMHGLVHTDDRPYVCKTCSK